MAAKERGGWLFKEEPEHYSFADLEKDGSTWWDGVSNSLARQNLRKVQPGDRVLFYHTGKEKAIVGEMRVIDGPRVDPNDADPKSVVVKVEAVKRWPRPLSLARIKQDAALAGWELARLPRLSVMPVSPEQWLRLEQLAAEPAGDS
jgi:predicted RNA-binding protein with PUA-like domain